MSALSKDVRRPLDWGDSSADMLVEIASLYYHQDITQEELSQRFSLSRAKPACDST